MKKLLPLAALAAVALVPSTALAKPPIESATGGGQASNLVLGGYSFAFTAKDTADGPKGQMQLTIEGGIFAGDIHARVICLAVAGNNARILGDVTESSSAFTAFTDRIVFQVTDNGEPGDGDTISVFQQLGPDECEPAAPGTDQLDGGNIQVRD